MCVIGCKTVSMHCLVVVVKIDSVKLQSKIYVLLHVMCVHALFGCCGKTVFVRPQVTFCSYFWLKTVYICSLVVVVKLCL